MRIKVYKHKLKTEDYISEKEYNRLDVYDQMDYKYYKTVNVKDDDSSGDFLTSAIIGGVTDSALLGGLLGGSFLGGALGDILDGDLFD